MTTIEQRKCATPVLVPGPVVSQDDRAVRVLRVTAPDRRAFS